MPSRTAAAFLVSILTITVAAAFFWYFNYIRPEDISGNQNLGIASSVIQPLISTVGTVLGVFAKTIYEHLNSGNARKRSLGASVVSSLIVSPLVVMYTYSALGSVSDQFLCFLISFQNGFFFRIVTGAIEANVAKTAADQKS